VFKLRRISYVSKSNLIMLYKENELKKYYIPDFLINEEIIVEI